MIVEKKNVLRPILESSQGLHLTAYLANRGDLADLKSQLQEVIDESSKWLLNVQTEEELRKFHEPLYTLLEDARILQDIKGNIGIFRNENSFRILNIPIDIEPSCQVATSFHVKPLLRWLQGDQDFLFLGIEKEAAHLYLGNLYSFKLVDSIYFDDFIKSKKPLKDDNKVKKEKILLNNHEIFYLIREWIAQVTQTSKPKLFIAAEISYIKQLNRFLKYKNLIKTPIATEFDQKLVKDIFTKIRRNIKQEAHKNFENALQEFRFAEQEGRTSKNIFQISKAVVKGRVRKLIVTDELSIFGKIDYQSGGLAIHPIDMDHEDDCILDDLAQMVLSQGGEVIVAKRDEIPKGRPIVAILDDDDEATLSQRSDLQEEYA